MKQQRASSASPAVLERSAVPGKSRRARKLYGSVFSDSKREQSLVGLFSKAGLYQPTSSRVTTPSLFSGIESCVAARNRSDDDLDKSGLPSDWATPRL
ncbi:hypothetical protein TNCV_4046791 [Trichonephila clavipes]|nr:hypothetical protein TNCV_4046791 [Trichonephila clavipes]